MINSLFLTDLYNTQYPGPASGHRKLTRYMWPYNRLSAKHGISPPHSGALFAVLSHLVPTLCPPCAHLVPTLCPPCTHYCLLSISISLHLWPDPDSDLNFIARICLAELICVVYCDAHFLKITVFLSSVVSYLCVYSLLYASWLLYMILSSYKLSAHEQSSAHEPLVVASPLLSLWKGGNYLPLAHVSKPTCLL